MTNNRPAHSPPPSMPARFIGGPIRPATGSDGPNEAEATERHRLKHERTDRRIFLAHLRLDYRRTGETTRCLREGPAEACGPHGPACEERP